ncbi:protein spire homolog 1-like isoform X2 [Pseudophryne corroboree]|uniref:protein spire homolog 1-like isoform X2 n=1 Tax=Pseudophryne corroboree TaxID=495146 RepID=UPI003081268C
MSDWGPFGHHSKVTLKQILESSGQPVSEEQAWALCYQCSCKLKQILLGVGYLPILRGIDNIYLHWDGTVSFAPSTVPQDSNVLEKKITEWLGKAVYTALDWGLGSKIERVLSDSLNNLLLCMLGLSPANSDYTTGSWCTFMLNDIIKQCVERMFVPSEASAHYRAVCRIQFEQHKDICKLLQTIELSKQALKRFTPKEDLKEFSFIIDENLNNVWSSVMNELRLGIILRSAKERTYNALPVEYTLTPYEQLMNDIRSKRYTLREVKECDQTKSSRSEDNVLDLIRSHRLKPASERKLKERSQEEPSLHELLMSEIKSSKTLRATFNDKRSLIQEEEFKSVNNLCSVYHDYSLYFGRMGRRTGPAVDLLDSGVVGRISWHSRFSYEYSPNNKSSDGTSSSTDLSFVPVLTSSQVDLSINSILNHGKLMSGHKRSSSYEGFIQGSGSKQSWRAQRIRLPPTISELVPVRRAMIKTEMLVFTSSSDIPGYKACSSCYRKRLFFFWPYSCKFCDRTMCPKCHIECSTGVWTQS